MQETLYENLPERKKIEYSKDDAIKLDTKFLYAGKIERIKQWKEPAHSHPFCEILFVLSGKGQSVVDGSTYEINKGDIIIYNANTTHSEFTPANEGFELAFFGITNFKFGNLPSDCIVVEGQSPILHAKGLQENFELYFRSLVDEVYENKPYSEIMAQYWARLILVGVMRIANVSEVKFATNAVFTRIHQYLTTNFANIESMEQICEDLKISKYYLSHVFKNYMGTPPMQYVTSKRISYAKKLLQETDHSATEIGEMCGYKDHVLFFKAFKKSEGITPIAYRKQTQGISNSKMKKSNQLKPSGK